MSDIKSLADKIINACSKVSGLFEFELKKLYPDINDTMDAALQLIKDWDKHAEYYANHLSNQCYGIIESAVIEYRNLLNE